MPNANGASLSGVPRIGEKHARQRVGRLTAPDLEGAARTTSVPTSTHLPAAHVNKCMLVLLIVCVSLAAVALGIAASVTRSALPSAEAIAETGVPEQPVPGSGSN
jgi:hypothetical protein